MVTMIDEIVIVLTGYMKNKNLIDYDDCDLKHGALFDNLVIGRNLFFPSKSMCCLDITWKKNAQAKFWNTAAVKVKSENGKFIIISLDEGVFWDWNALNRSMGV